ncbi:hypothetical protein [Salinactinospora qingdaonensis]|uniref:Uncharacterized protein n=1 Tax=Salinactinospora qingdaonensis TaxID=702744 RepID=A0ABP7FQK9_9ACTN
MSSAAERHRLTRLALTTWGEVAEMLAERGEVWPNTDPMTWGVGLQLAMARMQALAEASTLIGGPDLHQLISLYEQETTR